MKKKITEVVDTGIDDNEASGLEGYVAECDIVGLGYLGFSKPFETQSKGNEEELEKNNWRERIHVNPSTGNAAINPMALKKALDSTAKKQLGTIPGKGKSRYGGYFKSGLMVLEELDLGVKPNAIPPFRQYVALPGQGRHWKNFPRLDKWKTHARIEVLDGIITPEVLETCLKKAGSINGLGLYRPAQGGYWGRFIIENFKTKKA